MEGSAHDPDPPLASEVLLERAREGDLAAREALFERYRPLVLRLARYLYPSRSRSTSYDSEDLVQGTLSLAWTKLATYRGDAPFRAWLARILEHHVHSRRRHEQSEKRDQRLVVPLDSERGRELFAVGTPSAIYGDHEGMERVLRALAQLPEEERTLLALRFEQGLDSAAIAARLGTSEEAARKRLSRARARLGLLLSQGEEGEPR